MSTQTIEAQLLFALKNLLDVNEGKGGTAYPAQEIALAAIARAEGREYKDVKPLYAEDLRHAH